MRSRSGPRRRPERLPRAELPGRGDDRLEQRVEPGDGVLSERPGRVGLISRGSLDAAAQARVHAVGRAEPVVHRQLGRHAGERAGGVELGLELVFVGVADHVVPRAGDQREPLAELELVLREDADIVGAFPLDRSASVAPLPPSGDSDQNRAGPFWYASSSPTLTAPRTELPVHERAAPDQAPTQVPAVELAERAALRPGEIFRLREDGGGEAPGTAFAVARGEPEPRDAVEPSLVALAVGGVGLARVGGELRRGERPGNPEVVDGAEEMRGEPACAGRLACSRRR